MLVLTRSPKKGHDGIAIGDRITVRVLRLKDGSVRLGIEAPEDVNIRRTELPNHGPTTGRRGAA